MKNRLILSYLVAFAALSAAATNGYSQIFVADPHGLIGVGTIGKYNASGATVNPALLSGLNSPQGIAVSGDKLFVTNFENGTIGEYTTSGATVNPALISGLDHPRGIVVSGDKLFVAEQHWIGEFTTSGAAVEIALVSGFDGGGDLALSGDRLFITNEGGNGAIGEYTTSGATVNSTLVTGLDNPTGIAVSGGNLFVVNRFTDTIGKYTTSGEPVHPAFITGLHGALDVTVSGRDLFVTQDFGVGKYNAGTGAPIDETFLSGLDIPTGIAVVTGSVEPVPDTASTRLLLLLALTATFGLRPLLRRPA